jgi:hypothetical protein
MKTQDYYGTTQGAWRRTLARIAATGAVVALTACQATVVHERPTATVLGRVKTSGAANSPVLVLAFDRGTGKLANRAFLGSQSTFAMRLYSGAYKFYACNDQDSNGHCGDSELRSVMYSLSDPVNAGDVIQLPTFRLQGSPRVAAAR